MKPLHGFIHKEVKNYSLGMKQRLGLAQALLNEPELLILDEPTNGLDPEGVVEIRNIIKSLFESDKFIFLRLKSFVTGSHFLQNGKLLEEGLYKLMQHNTLIN